jgi:hypothetical protein
MVPFSLPTFGRGAEFSFSAILDKVPERRSDGMIRGRLMPWQTSVEHGTSFEASEKL